MGNVISPLIRFGTSTWTYEGWQGQVYKRQYSKTAFAREPGGILPVALQWPVAVSYRGNDPTSYRPSSANQLTRYLTQIPENFEMCFKVWEEVTIPAYTRHA